MKVIKRDGRAVEFDTNKIEIAIEKANKEVREKDRATKDEIKEIINYISELDRKRILVEDIQDIIEEQLMTLGHYELAKKYMIYRYTRALVRKSNSTDQSILGLIKNQSRDVYGNKNQKTIPASIQRDLIAGEVSKDLTKRILLPEKISTAHEEGVLYFHNSEYFLQPIFNSCIVNLDEMLNNGIVMNGVLVETPKSFQVACNVTTQVMSNVASAQYGGQTIYVSTLAKYLRKSKEKIEKELEIYKKDIDKKVLENMKETRLKNELASGVQTIQYQINTLMTTTGKPPIVTLFLFVKDDDEYEAENALIVEEILKQRLGGIKNENEELVSTDFPRLVYVLDENNNLSGGKYDYLTKLAIECVMKRNSPDFVSAKVMRKNYSGNVFAPMGCRSFLPPWKERGGEYKFEGRFNQGIVSINLPQIALKTNGDEKKFWEELDDRLSTCYEALMCKYYALQGTTSDVSPIHWRYGAIARIEDGEKIDDLLKGGYSTISLGFVGLYETTKIIKGVSYSSPEGKDFAMEVLKKIKATIEVWKKETGLGFVLYGTPSQTVCKSFAENDLDNFGKIKEITDKGFYYSAYKFPIEDRIDLQQRIKLESEFQNLVLGGAISTLDITNVGAEEVEQIIKLVYDNIQYAELKNDNVVKVVQ